MATTYLAQRNVLEDNINLENLRKLKSAFQDADENGGGSLDVNEFVQAFQHSINLRNFEYSEEHLKALFQKIDANCDGSIDWDEFSSYMLLENEVATVLRENELLTMYEEPSTRDEFTEPSSHRDVVSRMVHVSQGDRVITAGRDGCIKLWSGKDQSHIKTIKVSTSWVTDICYMSRLSKLASCSFNRSIKIYDLVTNEVVACSSDLENAPISMCSWTTSNEGVAHLSNSPSLLSQMGFGHEFDSDRFDFTPDRFSDDNDTFIATGDTGGVITFYNVTERDDSDNNNNVINHQKHHHHHHHHHLTMVDNGIGMSGNHNYYSKSSLPQASQDPTTLDKYVLKEQRSDTVHSDWVNKVMYISDLSAVASCSLDKTLCINDVERNYARKLTAHNKCVYSFDWSPSYKFLASCGMDRLVILWNPITRRPLHTLAGHTSAVQDVLILEEKHQILSLSVDKQIKVWDIRNHRCIQTVTDRTAFRPENKIGAITKDNLRKTILTATLKPKIWIQKKKELRGSGHSNSVVSALYNAPFKQVVSGDSDGAVCVWDVLTGRLLFRYADAHKNTKMTAMTFDSSMRRLITGAHDGSIKMWNFSNGSIIKTLIDDKVSGNSNQKSSSTNNTNNKMNSNSNNNNHNNSENSDSDNDNYKTHYNNRSGGGGGHSDSDSDSDGVHFLKSRGGGGGGGQGGMRKGESDEITELLFTQSATGTRHLIGVGWSREVIFWEDSVDVSKECLPTRRLHGHTEDILTVAQCPPSVLATGSYDGLIIIWNLESGAVKFRLFPEEYKTNTPTNHTNNTKHHQRSVSITFNTNTNTNTNNNNDNDNNDSDSSMQKKSGLTATRHYHYGHPNHNGHNHHSQYGHHHKVLSEMRAIEVIKFLSTKQYALLATGADGVLRLWNSVDGRLMWREHGGHKKVIIIIIIIIIIMIRIIIIIIVNTVTIIITITITIIIFIITIIITITITIRVSPS